jgi:hypothetical protein
VVVQYIGFGSASVFIDQVTGDFHITEVLDHFDLFFKLLWGSQDKIRHLLESKIMRNQGVETAT